MPFAFQRLRDLVHPTVKSEAELDAYVRRVTLGCVAVALAFDAVNNLVFFTTWTGLVRSLAITTVVAVLIAYPILRIMGGAHLELYRAKTAMEELIRRDPLTGLPNRRAMVQEAALRKAGGLLLAIADIDRFKAVNDTHGHAVGDAVIVRTGQIMAEELGDLGVVCRVGGEEFAFVAGPLEPELLRRRLGAFVRRLACDPMPTDGGAIPVTVSVGVASGRPDQVFAEVFSAADRALYIAKASGRNEVRFDAQLESRLDPPLPPDEIVWGADSVADAPVRAGCSSAA